jgi:hypothetical protein
MDKFKDTKIKIHLFGNTSFKFLTSFPIYSCDASTWFRIGSFGNIQWWNPNKGGLNKTDKIYLEEYIPPKPDVIPLSGYKYREELMNYLYDQLEITDDDLFGTDGNFFKDLINLHYYLKREEEINKIQKKKGFWTAE